MPLLSFSAFLVTLRTPLSSRDLSLPKVLNREVLLELESCFQSFFHFQF